MSLLDHIFSWATAQLKLWQRDAVRRLFQKQDLDQQDFDDLYAMLRSAHGLPDPQNRQPVPLAKEHLPAQVSGTSPVILRALRDLKHVNRIAPGQRLDFAPTGITVIYGGNASGKSGYSRVLKRACRARDLSETIHPDAFDAGAAPKVPEATFDIEVRGKVTPLAWRQGQTPPDQLSTISVFDGRSARAYLDTEQDVANLPYGLDIVESLGQRVLPTLSKYLNAELEAINTDTTPFADLLGDTVVGKMIASLTAASDAKKMTDLATLTNTMKVTLHPHARERISERGATEAEVIATVVKGERFPAKFGRTGFRRNFHFDGEWHGRHYATKQVEAYAVKERADWLIITGIVRYF